MKSFYKQLMLAAVLVGLVIAGTMMNPHSASATSAATLITIAEAGSPVSIYLCTTGTGPSCGNQSYTVGAGQHLIIEYVSGECLMTANPGTTFYLTDLSLQLTTGGQFNGHYVATPINNFVASPNTSASFTFAQPTRLYADPSTQVTLAQTFGSSGGSAGVQVCHMTISGRLITL